MDPLLLSAEDPAIKDHKNHKARQPWVERARAILVDEKDDISSRPFEEQLSLAAASYHFLFERLGYPEFEPGEWDKLSQLIKKLPADQTAFLVKDLELHNRALSNLQLPDEYFTFVNSIHEQAYDNFLRTPVAQELLPAWSTMAHEFIDEKTGKVKTVKNGLLPADEQPWYEKTLDSQPTILSAHARQRLDANGITFDKTVELMNAASIAMNGAWVNIASMPPFGVEVSSRPMRVVGIIWDQATPIQKQAIFGVNDDADGAYYSVSDRSRPMLDFRSLIHIGFHEPHHDIQKQLRALHKSGASLPDWIQEACILFSYRNEYRLPGCPASVFNGHKQLRYWATMAYRGSSMEEPAFLQGHSAELAFTLNYAPYVGRKTAKFFDALPRLLDRLPPDISNEYKKLYQSTISETANLPGAGGISAPANG